jgi:peptide/nickel transport system substrate-binding protein
MRVERSPSVLVRHISADPTGLNPVTSTDAYASDVLQNIYESLLERDRKTLELKPLLATSWKVSPDHLTYTFVLREGVRWTDGKPFTADDVLYSFERIKDPKVDAAHLRNYFKDITKVEKIGERTVRFTYARPYFKALEICGGMPIFAKHLFDDGQDFNKHELNRAPIGTGPYLFKEWITGSRITLTRNEKYWGKKPRITGMVYKVIPNSTVAFQLLKKGSLDLAGIRAIQWERQTESERFNQMFEKYRYYMPNYSYIGWNMRRPYFNDRRVRLAMTMLVDRKAILEKLQFGQGEVVTGNLYRFGPMYDDSIKPWPYDPARAAKLLDEAGWVDSDGDGIRDRDGLEFKFTFLVPAGSRFAQSVGLILSEELLKIGVKMEIRQLEWAAMINLLQERDFDATSLAWSTALEDDPYQVWHSTQSKQGSNFVGFENKRADYLIEKARTEFDPKKRAVLYHEFQGILHEEQPYTFLFTTPSLVVVSRRFTDVHAYRIGLDPLEWGIGSWEAIKEW